MFDSLATDGGHIAVGFCLILVGIVCNITGQMNGDHLVDFGFGIMARSMNGGAPAGPAQTLSPLKSPRAGEGA